jgi:hypothetical protein
MELKLKETLMEMKRLMDYNKSLIINEQKPDNLMPGQSDNPANKKKDNTPEDPYGYFSRQGFNTYKGFFEPEMALGKCFDVELFNDFNTNAKAAMEGPGLDGIQEDRYGYYINGQTGESYSEWGQFNTGIRIYLPDDAFFQKFIGTVKSFVAYETCRDQRDKRNGKKYTLMYELKDPIKAVAMMIQNEGGSVVQDTDPSRGWAVSQFASSSTGYFTPNTNKYGSATLGGQMLPSDYKEYNLGTYGSEYGKSAFDQWYDSGWGTVTFIVGNIIIGLLTAGVANAVMAALEVGTLTARFVVLGVELATEFAMAIPEAMYLFDRGMNEGAYLVLIFALLPLYTSRGTLKLAGKMSDAESVDLLRLVQAEAPNINTPAEMKSWLKKIEKTNPKYHKYIEDVLQNGSKVLEEVTQKQLIEDIEKGLKTIIEKEIEKKGVEIVAKNVEKKLLQNVTPVGGIAGELFKVLGVAGVGIVSIMTLFEDDEEIKNDPEGFYKKVTDRVKRYQELVKEQDSTKLKTMIKEYQERMSANPTDLTIQREYLDFMKLVSRDDKKGYDEVIKTENELYKEFLNSTLTAIQKDLTKAKENNDIKLYNQKQQDAAEFFGEMLTADKAWELTWSPCENLQNTTFTNINETCEFIDWVIQNKKDFKYTVQYSDGTSEVFPGIQSCKDSKAWNESDEITMKSCRVKNAFIQYGAEYVKDKGNYKFYYLDNETNQWVETTYEIYILYKELGQKTTFQLATSETPTNQQTQQKNTTQQVTNQTTIKK